MESSQINILKEENTHLKNLLSKLEQTQPQTHSEEQIHDKNQINTLKLALEASQKEKELYSCQMEELECALEDNKEKNEKKIAKMGSEMEELRSMVQQLERAMAMKKRDEQQKQTPEAKNKSKEMELRELELQEQINHYKQKIAQLSQLLEESQMQIQLFAVKMKKVECELSNLLEINEENERRIAQLSSENDMLKLEQRIKSDEQKQIPETQSKNESILQNQKLEELKTFLENYQEENKVLRKRCDMFQQALNQK